MARRPSYRLTGRPTGRPRVHVALRFWPRVKKSDGCWIFEGGASRYGKISDGVRKCRPAHSVSWELANGKAVPRGVFVLHACDVPRCVRPSHLFLGNAAINAADRDAKGRQARGIRQGSAKLSDEKVRVIRASRSQATVLGRRFGVTETAVRYARMGKTWRHVV